MNAIRLDDTDRAIINRLQQGLPVCDEPYQAVADELDISEKKLLKRIRRMLDDRLLTRFGPLFDAERLGGALSLCAMKIPPDQFDRVSEQVNAFDQVAHNYEREHLLNLWFVLATASVEEKSEVVREIEAVTGHRVFDMPKEKEYYVGLHLPV